MCVCVCGVRACVRVRVRVCARARARVRVHMCEGYTAHKFGFQKWKFFLKITLLVLFS
jgi:hypothetical protein